jgi:arginase
MDSHTPETTPSGAIHGMPLAALLGYGAPELVRVAGFSPKLLPCHLCLVGVRSFEAGEAELLRRLGVRVFFMDEVKRRGLGAVMADALAIARSGSAGYGISIDLDAFNPQESPGVGTPVRDGLHHLGLDRALHGIINDPHLIALELAEFNPERDQGGRTLKLIGDLLAALSQDD